jgi:hypothetical protein
MHSLATSSKQNNKRWHYRTASAERIKRVLVIVKLPAEATRKASTISTTTAPVRSMILCIRFFLRASRKYFDLGRWCYNSSLSAYGYLRMHAFYYAVSKLWKLILSFTMLWKLNCFLYYFFNLFRFQIVPQMNAFQTNIQRRPVFKVHLLQNHIISKVVKLLCAALFIHFHGNIMTSCNCIWCTTLQSFVT